MCSGRPRLLFLVHYNLLDNCILVCRAQQPVNLNPQPRQLHSGALNHPLHMIELGVLRVHIPMPHPLTASSGVQESKFLERPFVRYDFVLLPLYGVRLVTDTLLSPSHPAHVYCVLMTAQAGNIRCARRLQSSPWQCMPVSIPIPILVSSSIPAGSMSGVYSTLTAKCTEYVTRCSFQMVLLFVAHS